MLKLEKSEQSYVFSKDVKIKPAGYSAGTGGWREAPAQQVISAKLSSSSVTNSWGLWGLSLLFGCPTEGRERREREAAPPCEAQEVALCLRGLPTWSDNELVQVWTTPACSPSPGLFSLFCGLTFPPLFLSAWFFFCYFVTVVSKIDAVDSSKVELQSADMMAIWQVSPFRAKLEQIGKRENCIGNWIHYYKDSNHSGC